MTLEERIDKMIQVVMEIAKGNYSASFELSEKNDHLDALAMGLNVMLDDVRQAERRKKKFLTSLSRKNTQLQQTSFALKQSERYHRIFFEKSESFLCTHDRQGNILTVNKAGAKSIQYTPKELIGKNLRDIIAPTIRPQFDSYLKTICTERSAKGLMQIISKNGTARIWLYHNYLYEGGNESYVIGSAQDVTDRVAMEEELRKAKQIAEESEKIKEQFLANTSHEIRTPMNAIIGFTDLLHDTELNEEQKEYLAIIQQAGKNLLEIINDILDLSKIKAGKITIEKIDFSLSDLIRSSSLLFRTQAQAKGIKLITHIEKSIPPFVKGDPIRLKQIILNLLSNALKFTESGSIKLDVQLNSKTENGIIINFSVKDTGIGIPEDKLTAVFESFTQASNDTSRKYGGTGLGLAIVKNLVEIQGGSINVKSKKGKGSKFAFFLPFGVGNLIEERSQVISDKQKKLKNISILLVEDNKVNQRLAQVLLYKMGCEVDIAENGREAIKKLKNPVYDIILMDIQMPEMDGYETTEYIRNFPDKKINSIPIIAMTAHALSDEGNKCIAAGMNDYISKPFVPEALFDKIYQHTIAPSKKTTGYKHTGPSQKEEHFSVNLDYIKTTVGEDEKVLKEMIDLLCAHIPSMIEELKMQGERQNWDLVKKSAHKIKPTIMLLRLPELQKIIESIENFSSKKTNLESLPDMIKQAAEISMAVVEQLKKEQKKLNK